MKRLIKKVIDRISSGVAGKLKDANRQPKDEKSDLLLGKLISNLNSGRTEIILKNIQKAEFRVFSQWGDDGIIQFLVNYLDLEKKDFIEFGVEDYSESNTRFLLMNDNWKGLIMDGSETCIDRVVNSGYYWKYELTAKCLFVD